MCYEEFTDSKFIPDFYFIAPHGTGALSFLYYIVYLGCPSSNHESDYKDGKKTPIFYPVPKTLSISARGLSLDRFFLGKHLNYGAKKVIQLIRDPVEIITSVINWYISSAVCCGTTHGINIKILNNYSKIEFIMSFFNIMCMFTSMRNCIDYKNSTLFIDTSEICAEHIKNTMFNVSNYLNTKYNSILDIICQISYNSFSNRIWKWQPIKNFIGGQIGSYIGNISIYPTVLHDFHANYWSRAKIIDVFIHKDEEYTVSMPEKYFYERGKITRENIWDNSKRESMYTALDIWMAQKEVAEQLYKKYAMTPEETIALICSNPRFHSRFMRLMEHEISLPLKEVPQKVERWTHFHSL